MQLFQWLPANGVSQRAFADKIGVSQASLSRYIKGLTMPNVVISEHIFRLTGGEVTQEDWVELPKLMSGEAFDE